MISTKMHEWLTQLTGLAFAAIFPLTWLYWIVTEGLEGEQLMMAMLYLAITLGFIQIPFFIGLVVGSIFWAFFLKD
jgi:hypothetical protein